MKVSAVLFCLLLLCQCALKKELRPFTTDGCSLFPDRSLSGEVDWRECCVEHDFAYWKGGTAAERLAADERFRECLLKKTGSPKFARLAYAGVRLGGSPHYPTDYRWGYGWTYLRPAGPFTEEEQKMVDQRIKDAVNFEESCEGCGSKGSRENR
jgi:hypothetical protein